MKSMGDSNMQKKVENSRLLLLVLGMKQIEHPIELGKCPLIRIGNAVKPKRQFVKATEKLKL